MVVIVRDGAEVATWPLAADGAAACERADLDVVDRLARAQLTAHRIGYAIEVRDVCAELRSLIELAGLGEVLG